MTIIDTMDDAQLFRRWFGADVATWRAWRVFLAALFGLPIAEGDAALFAECTGRTRAPSLPATEAWMVVGRRGGKSRIAALVALFLCCFRDYREFLAPGEIGTLPIIAADRKQARTVMRYMVGLINSVPMLKQMLASEPTKETIEFTNHTMVEIHTASAATVRNYTIISAICDEIAFWPTGDEVADPDTDILNALRPGMGTIPDSMLIALSSPYARRGALFETFGEHFGQDDDEILVWKAPTVVMHPHTAESRLGKLIAKAYRDDESAAAAEYGAEFRRDIESFVPRERVDACVVPDRGDLPRVAGTRYSAFVDPSGGSQDSMTLAIAHEERRPVERPAVPGAAKAWEMRRVVVIDAVREHKAPFDPSHVVADHAALLQAYGVTGVVGDRYAGEWPRERYRDKRIQYTPAEKVRSDLYRDLLPLLTSGAIELPDHPRLIAQLCSLERRTGRGKDSIDHPPRGHDDVANAVAGVAAMASVPRCTTTARTSGY